MGEGHFQARVHDRLILPFWIEGKRAIFLLANLHFRARKPSKSLSISLAEFSLSRTPIFLYEDG